VVDCSAVSLLTSWGRMQPPNAQELTWRTALHTHPIPHTPEPTINLDGGRVACYDSFARAPTALAVPRAGQSREALFVWRGHIAPLYGEVKNKTASTITVGAVGSVYSASGHAPLCTTGSRRNGGISSLVPPWYHLAVRGTAWYLWYRGIVSSALGEA
jgi:hypothetical protein